MSIHRSVLNRLGQNDPSLTTLDLSYQSLSAIDIWELLGALVTNTYLTSLNLTGNRLENEGAALIAQHAPLVTLCIAANNVGTKGAIALAQHKQLRLLDISQNQIGNEGAAAFAKNAVLTTLNVTGNKIGASGASAFGDNTTLSELILGENQIDPEGVKGLLGNKTLLSLNLTKNQLGTACAVGLASHPSLTKLILCHNNIEDNGVQALAENSQLKMLDISYNKIGIKAMPALAKNNTLHILNLSGNKITNWGAVFLAQNQTLTELSLSYCQISDEGAVAISKIQSLLYLDLSHNQINPIGAKAIAQHPKLTQLDIHHNLLGDQGTVFLAQSQVLSWLNIANNLLGPLAAESFSENFTLKTLIMSYNLVRDAGAMALAKNTHLKQLWLSYNQIGDAGAKALAQNTTLELLGLNYNMIQQEGRVALCQNKAFKTLQLSEEQPPELTSENFNTLFLFSQDFLCIRSKAGIIQFFNPNFSRVLGYNDDELLGVSFYTFLHPNDRVKEEKLDIEGSRQTVTPHENRYRCKDGSYWWIRWNTHVKNNRIYAVGTDINYEKYIEEELSKKDKQMASDAVKAKLADIYAKEQADFIAHLCHEIRNPLSGIVGNMEIIESYMYDLKTALTSQSTRLVPSADVEITRNIKNIQQCMASIKLCTDYQQAILDDNLDIAKLAEKKCILENKVFDVKKALLDILHMFKAKAEQKKLQLNLTLPEEELLVKGDAARFKQVVINLVGNAIKFTQQGHIDIEVVVKGKTAIHTQLEITVTDTGIGLTEEECHQLFERFRQASANVAGQYGGSGLGLLIAKSLAQLMGGDIDVSSKKGQGSVFRCVIQCQNLLKQEVQQAQADSSTPSPTTLGEHVKPSRLRLLIVDDNEINRKILGFGLQKAGHEYAYAINGKDAVEKYKHGSYDAILMDIIMPEMNGIEATQVIRQYEQAQKRSRIPVIALTGNALQVDRKKALDAGMDDYVTKPFKIADILQKLTALVQSASEIKKTAVDRYTIQNNLGLFKSPTLQLLQGQLPNSDKVLEFSEEKICSQDGNCGFIALGTNRQQIYEVLIKLQQNSEAREQLSEEIKSAFMDASINSTIEWLELYRIYNEQQLNYDQAVRELQNKHLSTSTNQESFTPDEVLRRLQEMHRHEEAQFLSNLRLCLFQAEEKLNLYCKTPHVYNYYLQQLRDTTLWLGYKSAWLYATQQSINLYIWQKTEAKQLKCIDYYQTDSPRNSVHILHTDKFTHFNLLVIIRESECRIKPDLNLSEAANHLSLTM